MLPPFVKKFDFRGIYTVDITDEDAYYLGLALEDTFPIQSVLIGWDSRPSSKNLAMHLIQAFQYHGIAVSYIEKTPIDFVTSCAYSFDFDLSVMVTGSHNGANWTGLLLHTKGGESIQGEIVDTIVANYWEAKKQPFEKKNLVLSNFIDFSKIAQMNFLERVHELIPLESIKPLKILVDVGDGSGSLGLDLFSIMVPQITCVRLNDRKLYDQDSPHTADPSNIENMAQLITEIKKGGYDAGFAFDSDADRVLAVDEQGNYLNGSLLGSVMSEIFLQLDTFSTKKFGYAVDCGPSMHNTILRLATKHEGVTHMPIPVGRSIMRDMIRKGEIDFAVENVGHFYMKDFFMTDSGMFSLIMVLYWMSVYGPLSQVQTLYPDGIRGQVFAPLTTEEMFADIASQILERYTNLEIKKIDVDGVRYELSDDTGIVLWFAKRHSGYEQIVKYYFGAMHEEDFTFVQSQFSKLKSE